VGVKEVQELLRVVSHGGTRHRVGGSNRLLMIGVCDSARIKCKLMGFMVYF
jgi:hypothetical protein